MNPPFFHYKKEKKKRESANSEFRLDAAVAKNKNS
jgi:hypothetical protein